MTDMPKPNDRVVDRPVGYVVAPVRKRMTRPMHARRKAILAAAEAAFKPKPNFEGDNLESNR